MNPLPHRIGIALIAALTLPVIACDSSTSSPAADPAPKSVVPPSKDNLQRAPDIKA